VSSAASPHPRTGVRWLFGLLLGGLFLFLALRGIPLREVLHALGKASPGWTALALLGTALNNLAKVRRWQVLMAGRGQRMSFALGLRAALVGQMFNYVLPARTGDLSRAYLVGVQGAGTVYTLGTIALEKLVDTLFYGLLFLLTALFLPLPGWVDQSGGVLLAAAAALMLGAWFLGRSSDGALRLALRMTQQLPQALGARLAPRLRDALQTLEVMQDRRALRNMTLWSLFIWGMAVLPNWALLRALHLSGGWLAAMTTLVFLQAVVSLPGVPGRVGVFQYACILALGLFGVGEVPAFTYGVLLQAVAVLPVILGGVVSLKGAHWRATTQGG